MKYFNSTIMILTLVGATFGCTTARVYPICFYDKKPELPIAAQTFTPGLRQSFAAVVGSAPETVVVSPDVRWVVARTTDKQDADLLRIWPRIGCIGPGRSFSQVKLQADCIAYVEDFIKNRKYTQLGEYQGAAGNRYYNEARNPKHLVYCAASN